MLPSCYSDSNCGKNKCAKGDGAIKYMLDAFNNLPPLRDSYRVFEITFLGMSAGATN